LSMLRLHVLLPCILLVIVVALIVIFSVRRAQAPYFEVFLPPADRDLEGWGSMDSQTAARLQSVLDEAVNDLKMPGLQAYVRTPDNKTWFGVSGTVDFKRTALMRKDHILGVASVTKMFTAAVVLKLVDEGKLDLKDTLSKWFPDFPNAERITVRQLLNHTSGIPDIMRSFPVAGRAAINPRMMWNPKELIEVVARKKPLFDPGTDESYSNMNYILLGVIVEQVTGKAMHELYRERIFAPLGLEHSFFPPHEPAPNRITGFDRDLVPLPGIHKHKPDNTSYSSLVYTCGAMVSTAEDIGRFTDSLFGGAILSEETLHQMTDFCDLRDPRAPLLTGYGLGLFRHEIGGEELWGHEGQIFGFQAIALYCPDKNYTIAVVGNVSAFNTAGVVAELQEVIASRTPEPAGSE